VGLWRGVARTGPWTGPCTGTLLLLPRGRGCLLVLTRAAWAVLRRRRAVGRRRGAVCSTSKQHKKGLVNNGERVGSAAHHQHLQTVRLHSPIAARWQADGSMFLDKTQQTHTTPHTCTAATWGCTAGSSGCRPARWGCRPATSGCRTPHNFAGQKVRREPCRTKPAGSS
jgi:hypothetical protein